MELPFQGPRPNEKKRLVNRLTSIWKSPSKLYEFMKKHPPTCWECGKKMVITDHYRWDFTYTCDCSPFFSIEARANPKSRDIKWLKCGRY